MTIRILTTFAVCFSLSFFPRADVSYARLKPNIVAHKVKFIFYGYWQRLLDLTNMKYCCEARSKKSIRKLLLIHLTHSAYIAQQKTT